MKVNAMRVEDRYPEFIINDVGPETNILIGPDPDD